MGTVVVRGVEDADLSDGPTFSQRDILRENGGKSIIPGSFLFYLI
jgi:hypothetical protein